MTAPQRRLLLVGVVLLLAFVWLCTRDNFAGMDDAVSRLGEIKSLSESRAAAILRSRDISGIDLTKAERLYATVKAKTDATIASVHLGINNGFSKERVSLIHRKLNDVDPAFIAFTQFCDSTLGIGAGQTEVLQVALELAKYIEAQEEERRQRNRELLDGLRLVPWSVLQQQ